MGVNGRYSRSGVRVEEAGPGESGVGGRCGGCAGEVSWLVAVAVKVD